MLFHLRDGNIIENIQHSKELDESSFFINSNIEYDSELFNEDAIDFHEINLKKDDQIILSTDAISKYFLNNINDIDRFNEFNSFEKFKEFILTNWMNGILRGMILLYLSIIMMIVHLLKNYSFSRFQI